MKCEYKNLTKVFTIRLGLGREGLKANFAFYIPLFCLKGYLRYKSIFCHKVALDM